MKKKKSFRLVLVCEELSNDDLGMARGERYCRRYGRELVSKPAISLKKSWGATVVRLETRVNF